MEASQVQAAGATPRAAWKTKPSWYIVSTEDHIIPPDSQRQMAKRAGSTVVEVPGSHVSFVKSQTAATANLIETAAKGAVTQ